MLCTELLKKDHETVRKLFKEFESKEDDARAAGRIFEQCAQELTTHSKVEEELFYPELRDYKETREIVLESIEEHHVVEQLIEELRAMSPGDEAFAAKFTVLQENVEHHAGEEEKELFPKAERILGRPRSEWLAGQFQSRKQALAGGGRQQARKHA
jgi:hemerythrin superfamily protein